MFSSVNESHVLARKFSRKQTAKLHYCHKHSRTKMLKELCFVILILPHVYFAKTDERPDLCRITKIDAAALNDKKELWLTHGQYFWKMEFPMTTKRVSRPADGKWNLQFLTMFFLKTNSKTYGVVRAHNGDQHMVQLEDNGSAKSINVTNELQSIINGLDETSYAFSWDEKTGEIIAFVGQTKVYYFQFVSKVNQFSNIQDDPVDHSRIVRLGLTLPRDLVTAAFVDSSGPTQTAYFLSNNFAEESRAGETSTPNHSFKRLFGCVDQSSLDTGSSLSVIFLLIAMSCFANSGLLIYLTRSTSFSEKKYKRKSGWLGGRGSRVHSSKSQRSSKSGAGSKSSQRGLMSKTKSSRFAKLSRASDIHSIYTVNSMTGAAIKHS